MIIVKVPAPLFGEHPVEHLSAVRAEGGDSGALLLFAAPEEGASGAKLVAEYAPGRWLSWRAVDEQESTLIAHVRELTEQLEQAHAEAIDAAEDSDATETDLHPEHLDATGAADSLGPEYLAHVDDRLLFLLNVAGREWGPMGVALAAAHMSDPREVRRSLKRATR